MFAENETDFSVEVVSFGYREVVSFGYREVVSFGYRDVHEIGNLFPQSRVKLTQAEIIMAAKYITDLFSDERQTIKMIPFSSKKARFSGETVFFQGWACPAESPSSLPTTP